jgi:predicted PurR-regulated permease PerM
MRLIEQLYPALMLLALVAIIVELVNIRQAMTAGDRGVEPVTWRRWLPRAAFWVAIIALLWTVRAILVPFIVGIAIAYLANPFLEWLERRQWPRPAALAAGAVIIVVILVVLGWQVVPLLTHQVSQLVDSLPGYRDSILTWIQQTFPRAAWEYMTQNWKRIAEQVAEAARFLVGAIGLWAVGLFSNIVTLVVAFIVAIYLLLDYDRIRRWAFGLVPSAYRESTIATGRTVSDVLGAYLRGMALMIVVVGTVAAILMAILGVPYWLLLGVAVGVGYAIPYFGLPIAAALAALVAALSGEVGWINIIGLLAGVLIINSAADYLLTPRLVGAKVGLHPLVVIFALLAGGALFSIPGMIIAVPVAASVKVILYQVYPDLFRPASAAAETARGGPADQASGEPG